MNSSRRAMSTLCVDGCVGWLADMASLLRK